MKILESHTTATVKTETYRIATEEHGIVTYIEYLNEKGKVIDEILRDEEGNNIDGVALLLLEEIQEFVDSVREEQRRDEKHGLSPTVADVAN